MNGIHDRKRKKIITPFQRRIATASKYVFYGVVLGIALNNVLTPPVEELREEEQHIVDQPHPHEAWMAEVQPSLNKHPTIESVNDWSCSWFPNDRKQCSDLFRRRLATTKSDLDHVSNDSFDSKRWLFFGDSTMKRLFDLSDLKNKLVYEPSRTSKDDCLGKFSCDEHVADRCEINSNFGLPYAEKWIPPDPNMFEGPKKYGARNNYCTDCSGCQSHFLECRLSESNSFNTNKNNLEMDRSSSTCNHSKRRYGGFMTMEFARDKEIQTPEFQTTQENIAAYVARIWNTPKLLQYWGKPICVLGAGIHDILLDGITTEDFVRNVKFMLTVMMPVCEHLVWLGNTTNGRKSEYLQTMRQMKIWDRAVKELIESEPELLKLSSFIDVIDASLTFPHADFIHMNDKWYSQLGEWFTTLM